ncbi:MAG TPA: hypothetical protein VHO68_07325, partial [Bacteroidales bacterium]|nr:hypothetical protein [Bacteroidales bacterium]
MIRTMFIAVAVLHSAKKGLLLLIPLMFSLAGISQHTDEFMVSLYDKLHSSEIQDKFRNLHPMPAGVVYVQHPGEGEKEIRAHFRLMKQLGFNALKQIQTVPGWTVEQISLIALEEGIIPWWYGEGGWENITPELLKKLKIPENTPLNKARVDPAMVSYQTELLKQRVINTIEFKRTHSETENQFLSGGSRAYDPQVGGRGIELNEKGESLFIDWCIKKYG